MLDVLDFIADRGGDPEKVRESQRRRYTPEGVVDEVIALYEEARKSIKKPSSIIASMLLTYSSARYEAQQIGTRINTVQKEIGQMKKVPASTRC